MAYVFLSYRAENEREWYLVIYEFTSRESKGAGVSLHFDDEQAQRIQQAISSKQEELQLAYESQKEQDAKIQEFQKEMESCKATIKFWRQIIVRKSDGHDEKHPDAKQGTIGIEGQIKASDDTREYQEEKITELEYRLTKRKAECNELELKLELVASALYDQDNLVASLKNQVNCCLFDV